MEGRRKAMTYRLLAVNTFVWTTTALYMPFIGAYYTQQGITPLQIGILTSIGPVVSILIQPLWAYISDRSGRHRLVLIIVSIGSGAAILSYLVRVSFGAFMVATVLLTLFNTSILPLSDALVTNLAAKLEANFAHRLCNHRPGAGEFSQKPSRADLRAGKRRIFPAGGILNAPAGGSGEDGKEPEPGERAGLETDF